jgi:hypothetical protein
MVRFWKSVTLTAVFDPISLIKLPHFIMQLLPCLKLHLLSPLSLLYLLPQYSGTQ